MRPWRKLYSSILESERFMDVSTEAKVLFFLLVAAQDDSGYYPWERMKVRHLVATCGWSEEQARKHAESLVVGGMATWEEGGIVLRNGKELNGRFREDRHPLFYQRDVSGKPVVSQREEVVQQEEKERRRRGDREEIEKENTPVWRPPDWFLPLTRLSGYKVKNHQKAAEGIEAACIESGAEVALVVAGFAQQWPTLKVKYRWNDPVATLRGKPLEIAIEQSKNGGNNGGRTSPANGETDRERRAREFLEEAERFKRTGSPIKRD